MKWVDIVRFQIWVASATFLDYDISIVQIYKTIRLHYCQDKVVLYNEVII